MNSKKIESIPTVFVVFGATGDLAKKKIFPSLFHLHQKNRLPKLLNIIGFSRREWDDEKFRDYLKEVLQKHEGDRVKAEEFLKLFTYKKGDFEIIQGYNKLAEELGRIDDNWKVCANKLFYLAVPPKYYKVIFDHLESSGLTEPCSPEEGWTRVLVEKPFGKNEDTANTLDKHLSELFKEEQIYRIDHYLGKEMLQNILTFRFANNMFEQAWNSKYIESIDIKLLEKGGVEDRGTFYDGVGALRDVGQNHLLQMLSLITMDHPVQFRSEEIREKRAEVLKSLKVPSKLDLKNSVRGQYETYKEIDGVGDDSETETYFKVKAHLDHPRWQGVSVTLESGKKMGEQLKEIVITFRHPEPCLCPPDGHYQNRVIFSLEPKEEIRVEMFSKEPGLKMQTRRRVFDLPYRKKKESAQYTEEYEKLLVDAIAGDQTLFISSDEVQAMWKYVDPFVDAWEEGVVPLTKYKVGSKKIREVGVEDKEERIKKEIGIVGLGKMGKNLSLSLIEKGWKVLGYNRTEKVTKRLEKKGLQGTYSLKELVESLKKPRVIWLMLPAGKPVEEKVTELKDLLSKGDILIEGGNSFFEDSIKNSKILEEKRVEFVDVGVSGGPEGARYGACLMIGGKQGLYEKLLPLYKDISIPEGHEHFEGVGAGHFVKMVHNGIEYGMMQAIAEGFDVFRNSKYKLHLDDIANVYNHGSVIESRLISWMSEAFEKFGDELKEVSGSAGSGGDAGMEKSEAKWTLDAAKKLGVKAPVIEDAIKSRLESQKKPNYQGKVINALRNMFGGHTIDKEK